MERNHRSFENMEKTLDELKVLSQRSLFEWSCCWGFTESLSLLEFLFSLRLSIWFPSFSFDCLFLLFLIVHHHEQLIFFFFFLLIIVLLLPIKKKKNKIFYSYGDGLQLAWLMIIKISFGNFPMVWCWLHLTALCANYWVFFPTWC